MKAKTGDAQASYRIKPGSNVNLKLIDTADTGGFTDPEAAVRQLSALKEEMASLQQRLWADNRHAVLVVFQAMDAGGKDGVVRHVMSGLNPAGCHVTSFKAPTPEELDHDYLWRIHHMLPPYGTIGVFNRSHYEDVLIVRVHSLVPDPVWKRRYEEINLFERHLHENRIHVVKFFLHISKKEQERRFLRRLLDPKKNWKFLPGDLTERGRWDDYMRAYADALARCSTPWAPWHVIPADHKWYRDLAVARILARELRKVPSRWPKPTPQTRTLAKEARRTGKLPKV